MASKDAEGESKAGVRKDEHDFKFACVQHGWRKCSGKCKYTYRHMMCVPQAIYKDLPGMHHLLSGGRTEEHRKAEEYIRKANVHLITGNYGKKHTAFTKLRVRMFEVLKETSGDKESYSPGLVARAMIKVASESFAVASAGTREFSKLYGVLTTTLHTAVAGVLALKERGIATISNIKELLWSFVSGIHGGVTKVAEEDGKIASHEAAHRTGVMVRHALGLTAMLVFAAFTGPVIVSTLFTHHGLVLFSTVVLVGVLRGVVSFFRAYGPKIRDGIKVGSATLFEHVLDGVRAIPGAKTVGTATKVVQPFIMKVIQFIIDNPKTADSGKNAEKAVEGASSSADAKVVAKEVSSAK